MVKPFLKWAGGKQQVLEKLLELLPADINVGTYREPFLGAGALFFAVQPRAAVLSDANEHLVACFQFVRANPDLVGAYLAEHSRRHSERYYYRVREQYNNGGFSAAQAARFIYLNKACFNGIFRVNMQGKFNVPWGNRAKPCMPTLAALRKIGTILQNSRITSGPFEAVLGDARAGDFVYLDPPYPPLNGTSYFTHYTSDKFTSEDHERVAEVARTLCDRGCRVMISNARTRTIERLYHGFNLHAIDVTRYITCKKVKHKVQEVVITSYDVGR